MDINNISFEHLPKAVSFLAKEIAEIKSLIQNVQIYESKEKSIPIDIIEASRLIGKAKSTIYALVRQRKIPCYKYGKKLYFFEDELLEWISKWKKKTIQEIESEALKYNHKNR
ncbi:helix-turn-helix domain-containing protein [Flavobacterium johnsoniae]|uniref:DNA binding domain, excisionase family n=1 Tax=Flavobacterium johnsoniae (strain ATCC 17061 / DSM 2064 / JCM 8514 / BCRC 14874 / CCUG 350202 / NBRC 14942 / NCIMB 11054 / UW101) TaxID=376686 RepID=A5FDX3_FLAJ1|nr:helix-turn-helix domain-containing protein [Flavobacterium johnsoniae]ABQ06604.1 DNA binding domain, excisionase family [Flavobacterium johnsoniae UW101]OXE99841.1 DNA-binding protein [Flavobacterium johnsoniae UW101]WQG82356.1 helix-turn-helix domain-containing protein [Flavobacterium johnsoniae UW101]SHK81027.1 DNA binding domain-containing protein, excisionase family [Flavobacterium johnsoniae]